MHAKNILRCAEAVPLCQLKQLLIDLINAHVDLAGAGVVAHRLGLFDEVFGEFILTHEIFDRVTHVGVGQHRLTTGTKKEGQKKAGSRSARSGLLLINLNRLDVDRFAKDGGGFHCRFTQGWVRVNGVVNFFRSRFELLA